jgi:hypothetical protein
MNRVAFSVVDPVHLDPELFGLVGFLPAATFYFKFV